MRLIDADAMNEELFYKQVGGKDSLITAESAFEMINAQPTAYDADGVVEQLKEELKLSHKEKCRCQKENMLQFFEAKGYEMGVTNAIEIVKGGGADENRD